MAIKEMHRLRIIPTKVVGSSRANIEIYKPFFLAGIISVLTAGCTLGAIALFGISQQGSYTASAWTPYVLAHANSQLYGWVGFFIIGFALQQHAPRMDRLKLFHWLAWSSLVLMAVGIGLRFAAEPLVHVDPSLWRPIGVGSCVFQTIAVVCFIANTTITRHRKGEKLPWQSLFVFTSLGWMLAVAIAEPFYFAAAHQPDPTASVLFVAKYFAPYRDAQFIGFVGNMIFGVALVKMNSCFGARTADKTSGQIAFVAWNLGLISHMLGWLTAFRAGMTPESFRFYQLGSALLATGAAFGVHSLGIFSKLELRLSSHKFIRAALLWLLVGAAMMLLEPFHLRAIGMPFSHAYTGAVRHALTVGFISQMILGVGLHVAHKMNDIPDALIPKLWTAFLLLNIGNAARVGLEVATDYSPQAFALMGITGFVELTALALWAIAMGTTMLRKRRFASVG